MDRPTDREIGQSRGLRKLFDARIPWLSTVIVACVVGLMSWATVKASRVSVAPRKVAWSHGSISYEDAVAVSLMGEAVIVDARTQEEREWSPIPGGAIAADLAAHTDFSTPAPGGIPESLLHSLQEVPIYVCCSTSKEARRYGLRLANVLRTRKYQAEVIRQDQ